MTYRPLPEDEQPSMSASWTLLDKVPLSSDDPAYRELPTSSALLTVSKLPVSPADVPPGDPEPAI